MYGLFYIWGRSAVSHNADRIVETDIGGGAISSPFSIFGDIRMEQPKFMPVEIWYA